MFSKESFDFKNKFGCNLQLTKKSTKKEMAQSFCKSTSNLRDTVPGQTVL